jgi:hypothetical protein
VKDELNEDGEVDNDEDMGFLKTEINEFRQA